MSTTIYCPKQGNLKFLSNQFAQDGEYGLEYPLRIR